MYLKMKNNRKTIIAAEFTNESPAKTTKHKLTRNTIQVVRIICQSL